MLRTIHEVPTLGVWQTQRNQPARPSSELPTREPSNAVNTPVAGTAWWRATATARLTSRVADPPTDVRTEDERDAIGLWWQTYLWLAVNRYLRYIPPQKPAVEAVEGEELIRITHAFRTYNISRDAIYKAMRRGELTQVVVPDSPAPRVRVKDLETWLATRRLHIGKRHSVAHISSR